MSDAAVAAHRELHGGGAVVRAASGNFFGTCDSAAIGCFAVAIGQAYFFASGLLTSLLQSLATFGAGLLLNPATTSVGIVVLAATTGHATIGSARAVLVTPAQPGARGWRVPLAAGCLPVPLPVILRCHLTEGEALARRDRWLPVAQLCARLPAVPLFRHAPSARI